MTLTGQATLRSPAFTKRLSALLDELRALGCTVWLEGMSVRFDMPERELPWVRAGGLRALLERYEDVVIWLPEEGQLELEAPPAPPPPRPRWRTPSRPTMSFLWARKGAD